MTLPTFATVQSGSIVLDSGSPGSLIKVSQGTLRKRLPREELTASGDGAASIFGVAKRPTYWLTGVGWLVDGSGNFIDLSLAASISGSLVGRISSARIKKTTKIFDVSAAGDIGTVDTVANTLYSVWAPGTVSYEGTASGRMQASENLLGRGTDYPTISTLTFPIGGSSLSAAAVVEEMTEQGSFREGGPWEGSFNFAMTATITTAPPFALASSTGITLQLSNSKSITGNWIASMISVDLDYAKAGRIPVSFSGPFTGPVSDA